MERYSVSSVNGITASSTGNVVISIGGTSSGTSGSSGVSGSSGSSGLSGSSGSSGNTGTSGVNGVDGSSGSSGSSGLSGSSGSSGNTGTSGVNGADGSSGSSGTSGVNGSSGSSGEKGTSGSSGSSGVSGFTSSNLSYIVGPTSGIVTSDTGTDATLTLADNTNSGLLSPGDFTKLTNIAFVYVDEGNGAGIIINGRDAAMYGPVGYAALDFSWSGTTSNVFGAIGVGSFVFGNESSGSNYGSVIFGDLIFNNGISSFDTGFNHYDAGYTNTLFGMGHSASTMNVTVVGQAANIIDYQILDINASPTKPLFVVGNGTVTNNDPTYTVLTRSDALIVRQNGSIEGPDLTNGFIDSGTGSILVTKDWVLSKVGGSGTSGSSGNTNGTSGSSGSSGSSGMTGTSGVDGGPILAVREISTPITLSNSDNALVIILTASTTIDIPNGLTSIFECTFVTLAGVVLTLTKGTSVVLFNNIGLAMPEKSSCTMKSRLSADNYILLGAI